MVKRIADVSTDRGGINHEARGFMGKCSGGKKNPNSTRRRSENEESQLTPALKPDLLLPAPQLPLGGLSEGEQLNGRRHQSRES